MKKAELQSKYQLLIGGQWKDASDGEALHHLSPQTGAFWQSAPRLQERM